MNSDNRGRATLISVITTPLGFFALSLLIVEGFLGIILIGSGLESWQKFTGMWIGAGLFVLVVLLVTLLAWFKPQSLTFGEQSYIQQQKMYGDQGTPKSEKGLNREVKVEATPEIVKKTKPKSVTKTTKEAKK